MKLARPGRADVATGGMFASPTHAQLNEGHLMFADVQTRNTRSPPAAKRVQTNIAPPSAPPAMPAWQTSPCQTSALEISRTAWRVSSSWDIRHERCVSLLTEATRDTDFGCAASGSAGSRPCARPQHQLRRKVEGSRATCRENPSARRWRQA